MLHLMKELPPQFGKILIKLLQMLCRNIAKLIIIAFDRYLSPSQNTNLKEYDARMFVSMVQTGATS